MFVCGQQLNQKRLPVNRRRPFLIVIFFSLLVLIFAADCLLPSSVLASNPKKDLKEVQKKLRREKSKVTQTIKKEKSILSEIEQINKTIRKRQKELRYYDKRLSETRSRIRRLENEITLLNGKLKTRKSFLKERLKSLYKQQRGDIVSILVSAKDYQDLIKRSKYISFIAYYDSKQMRIYSNEINELNIKMKRMKILRKDLEMNKRNVKKKTKELQSEREKKNKLFASLKSKRKYYEKMVKELEESSKDLLEMIKQLEKEKLPLSVIGKGFKVLKGRLPWPIMGEVIASFGKYNDPTFNITTFRKGIEIKSGAGNTVLAVAGGRVVYADWFKGYGLLLIINHGAGHHTLYAHLSEIFHKTGDIIKRRQAVGKIGESGILNVPSLYFEIRYKGKPVNPIKWLKKKTKGK